MRLRNSIKIIASVAALALVVVSSAVAATNIHRANLTGGPDFPAVNGSAKFGVDNGVNQLEAEIQDANALDGTKVRFIVDGTKVAAKTVNNLGTARIDVSGATVPTVVTGSKIIVRSATGQLVARGKFN
jgi:hypothetical protein